MLMPVRIQLKVIVASAGQGYPREGDGSNCVRYNMSLSGMSITHVLEGM